MWIVVGIVIFVVVLSILKYDVILIPVNHEVHIFGHSLDVTDKDVLRDLILSPYAETTIYYLDNDDLGRKITNLVKVIGPNELVKKTGGATKTITFKPQSPMETIKTKK